MSEQHEIRKPTGQQPLNHIICVREYPYIVLHVICYVFLTCLADYFSIKQSVMVP